MRLIKNTIAGILILFIPILAFQAWLRYEKSVETKSVVSILKSSPRWHKCQVQSSVSWRIVVVGVVNNDTDLKELKKELQNINARKTTVLVNVQQ